MTEYTPNPWNDERSYRADPHAMLADDWAETFRVERERDQQMFHPWAVFIGLTLLGLAIVVTL